MRYFPLLIMLIFGLTLATGCTTGQAYTQSYVLDHGQIDVFFCPQDDCEGQLFQFIDSAQQSIHCALYELNLPSIQQKLLERSEEIDVKIIVDDDYLHKFNHSSIVRADKSGLMHNKFCIIDGVKISTGSMNPTINDAHKNNNNLLLIQSPMLAQNYEAEFQEMWNGVFKKGGKNLNSHINLDGALVHNYFCPEDGCAFAVVEELKKAKKEIYFMTFSFTQEHIGNVLLLKNLDNVSLRGVMEVKQISKYSIYEQLALAGIDVRQDGNKYNLHHKVFIIDNETVISGSFNPTDGGDTRNDENVLIITDKKIAGFFLQEFEKVWMEAESVSG